MCSRPPCLVDFCLFVFFYFFIICLLFCSHLSNMATISQSEGEHYQGPTRPHRSRRALPCLGAAHLGKIFNLVTWYTRPSLIKINNQKVDFFFFFYIFSEWVNKLSRSPRASSCLFATCVEADMKKEKRKTWSLGRFICQFRSSCDTKMNPVVSHTFMANVNFQAAGKICFTSVKFYLYLSATLSRSTIWKSTPCCPPDATPPSRLWSRSSRPRCPTTTWPALPGWGVSTGSSTARDARHHSTKGSAHTGRQRRKKNRICFIEKHSAGFSCAVTNTHNITTFIKTLTLTWVHRALGAPHTAGALWGNDARWVHEEDGSTCLWFILCFFCPFGYLCRS